MAITKIGTPELFDFSATNTALQLPTGDTASRPSAPSAGEWRFNSELKYVEYWDGGSPGAWRQIDTEAPANPDDFPSQNFNVNTYFGTGATQAIDAKFNEAANFNGSSSKIVVANSGTIFDAAGGFSASVWVNRNTTANQTILNKEGGVSGSYGWSLRFTSGLGYSYDVYDTSNNQVTVSTGANSTTGNWENIVISFNNSDNKLRIYFDGGTAVVSSALPSAASSNTENFFIGARTTSGIVTDGKIDQVRIYSAAITDAQANDLYTDETTTTAATLNFPVGAGCIAAYQLDGNGDDIPSTQTATTVATYQLNGPTLVPSIPGNTYPGTPSNISFVAGKFGDAADFNGSSSEIVAANSILPSSGGFSISWWQKTTQADNSYSYTMDTSGGSLGNGIYIITHNVSTGLIIGFKNGSTFGSSSIPYTSSERTQWTHFCFSWDGTTSTDAFKIYKNNVATSFTSTVTNGGSAYPFRIGRSYNGTDWFGGKIDQVRLFDTALPQSAVTSLYNETVATSSSASISYQYGTYDGTTTDIGYTGLLFQPDLIWMKNRSSSANHALFDSVRGTEILYSNLSNAQSIWNSPTFDSNGFTLSGNNASSSLQNASGSNYVAWCFKAGGNSNTFNVDGTGYSTASAAGLATGDITPTGASVNTATGFSIVSYTGGGGVKTVSHGLSAVPELMFIKNTSRFIDGAAYQTGINSTGFLFSSVSGNEAFVASRNDWMNNNTAPSPSVFTVRSYDGSGNNVQNYVGNFTGDTYIAYLFHSIANYQKIGSYTGNNGTNTISTEITSGDGGFEPAFLLVKNTASGSTNNWIMVDNKRSPVNQRKQVLNANLSNNETTETVNINFLTNGFQLTNGNSAVNDGSGTYIYLAIAADK